MIKVSRVAIYYSYIFTNLDIINSGTPRFTVTKDSAGVANLTPHTEALTVYNLTVSTTNSPTDIPCSTS